MKCKYLLTTCLCLIFAPLATAENVKNLSNQGQQAQKQGNYTQAAQLYKQACNSGDGKGCFGLGFLYRKGYGVTQNEAQAIELWGKSCQYGYPQGCAILGVLYQDGKGVKQNYAQAVQLYEKACNGGDVGGCLNLGVLY
ncbi:MAG: sel1 repeat family protein, partial [Neisseriaceae bacterium]|nr:sel1 repeat family protein [Neisseriaceae bacterium]